MVRRTASQRWTLAELAADAGLPARTIRFYIARGLLPRPAGAGRAAVYGKEHRERLEAIRKMQARGMTLAEIARALGGEQTGGALPGPSAWWSYPLQEDVLVWVRADSSPWRLRQVRTALEQMAAQLKAGGKEPNDGGK